jgi:hypothetical protein
MSLTPGELNFGGEDHQGITVVAPTGPTPRSQFPIELEARLPLAA